MFMLQSFSLWVSWLVSPSFLRLPNKCTFFKKWVYSHLKIKKSTWAKPKMFNVSIFIHLCCRHDMFRSNFQQKLHTIKTKKKDFLNSRPRNKHTHNTQTKTSVVRSKLKSNLRSTYLDTNMLEKEYAVSGNYTWVHAEGTE